MTRTLTLVALIGLLANHADADPAPAPSATSAPVADTSADWVRIEYVKPKNPAHEPLYVDVRSRHLLEQYAEAVKVFRLPRTLTLKFAGCDGESNAFYLDTTKSVIFCYELLADIHSDARKVIAKHPHLSSRDAVDGPTTFFTLHEIGHAVFDLLEIPVFGKEEDAADIFATVALIHLDPEFALRMISGAAWAFQADVRRHLDASDFADTHSLDSQRYYEILCLAYGSNADVYATAVKVGKLPPERAARCGTEYRKALYAFEKLLSPSTDVRQLDRVIMQHKVEKLPR